MPLYSYRETAAQILRLELRARHIVDGLLSGRHPGRARGAAEFATHRQYSPGDDLRRLDWKALGRTDRHVIKQFADDTDLDCWLVVDVSESMSYSSGSVSKYDHAAVLAAALAYYALTHQDRAGLVTCADSVRRFVPPSSQPARLRPLLELLAEGPTDRPTRLAEVLHELAERIPRRGLIILLSDLFDEPSALLDSLRHLRFERHEIIVLQVMDPAEIDFPFALPVRFAGLENLGVIAIDPRAVADGYRAEVNRFIDDMKRGCRTQNIDYALLRTDQDAGSSLARLLTERAHAFKR